MGMATPEMIWETNAKKTWCHVNGSPSRPEHTISEGKFKGKLRHSCSRCGMWLEPEIEEK